MPSMRTKLTRDTNGQTVTVMDYSQNGQEVLLQPAGNSSRYWVGKKHLQKHYSYPR